MDLLTLDLPGIRKVASGKVRVLFQMREIIEQLGLPAGLQLSTLGELGSPAVVEHAVGLLLASTAPIYAARTEDGQPTIDVDRFLSENLTYTTTLFDAVLCWDIPDYLPEAIVRPAVVLSDRIVVMTAGPGRIENDAAVQLARPRDVSAVDFNQVRRDITQQLTSHVAVKSAA